MGTWLTQCVHWKGGGSSEYRGEAASQLAFMVGVGRSGRVAAWHVQWAALDISPGSNRNSLPTRTLAGVCGRRVDGNEVH